MKNPLISLILSSTKIISLMLLMWVICSCSEESTSPAPAPADDIEDPVDDGEDPIDEIVDPIDGIVDPIDDVMDTTVYQNSISIPLGGNAYQTDGSASIIIGENGVSFWDNANAEFSAFVYSDVDMTVRLDIEITTQTGPSSISIEKNGITHEIDLLDNASGLIQIGEFELQTGYNEFEFRGLQKAGTDYADIVNIVINHNDPLQLNYVLNNEGENFLWGRRGPSVHMNYDAPSDRDFQWFYNEMTIPMNQDHIGSYFMANGFNEGYFGIQVNSETERRVLFSVWSPFVTDDPSSIPEESQIQLLKKGENVITGEFGNEGSGGQSYMVYDWSPDITYKFLNSATPDGLGNTIYTAYFMDPGVGEWMLLASFLRPQTDTWYSGQYSFLENFIPEQGFLDRSVQFDNQWMFDTDGEPVELTTATFTGDNVASISYRLDFSGGIQTDAFFLRNGGFFNGEVDLFSQFSRNANGEAPIIDFDALP